VTTPQDVPAHVQTVTHDYTVHYPAHEPRTNDPHHADFEEWKRRRRVAGTYDCDFALKYRPDFSECDLTKPLEAHHSVIEFALQNGVDIKLLEQFYPGVSQEGIGAWIDSDQNLTLLCTWHHRGHGGVHLVSASDWVAYKFVKGMISLCT
jgi:hypothetical protein